MAFDFRPHHFLCALNFQGRGYSPAFTANFQYIVDTLNSATGDLTKITVTTQSDSICAPCPSRQEHTCATADTITTLDTAHMQALGIQDKQQLTWSEAKQKIKDRVSIATFQQICAACSWKSLGICESALKAYLNTEEGS